VPLSNNNLPERGGTARHTVSSEEVKTDETTYCGTNMREERVDV